MKRNIKDDNWIRGSISMILAGSTREDAVEHIMKWLQITHDDGFRTGFYDGHRKGFREGLIAQDDNEE